MLMFPVVNNIIEEYQNDEGFVSIVINNINIFWGIRNVINIQNNKKIKNKI